MTQPPEGACGSQDGLHVQKYGGYCWQPEHLLARLQQSKRRNGVWWWKHFDVQLDDNIAARLGRLPHCKLRCLHCAKLLNCSNPTATANDHINRLGCHVLRQQPLEPLASTQSFTTAAPVVQHPPASMPMVTPAQAPLQDRPDPVQILLSQYALVGKGTYERLTETEDPKTINDVRIII